MSAVIIAAISLVLLTAFVSLVATVILFWAILREFWS